MTRRMLGIVATVCIAVAAAACTGTPAAPAPTGEPDHAPGPPVAPAPAISIAPPTPLGPANGGSFFGWPTFTVRNADRTNTSNALLYRFDVSTREDFASVAVSGIVPESAEQTSYTPPSTSPPPDEGRLYWRALAIDQSNAVQSTPSEPQSFVYYVNSQQNRIGAQLYGSLWGDARPTGTRGRAKLGPGWQVRTLRSFDGVLFQSPPLETLRVYDLLDLGYQPQAAIDWMRARGYPVTAVWYPGPIAIGFPFQYAALVNGEWELVVRVGL
jgi:hypothetical protein